MNQRIAGATPATSGSVHPQNRLNRPNCIAGRHATSGPSRMRAPAAVGAKPQRPSASAAARLASGTTIVFEPGPLAAAAVSATPAVVVGRADGDPRAPGRRDRPADGRRPGARRSTPRAGRGRRGRARGPRPSRRGRSRARAARSSSRRTRSVTSGAGRAGGPAPRGRRVLGLEAEPLVERAAHVGREEQDRLGAARVQARARAARERARRRRAAARRGARRARRSIPSRRSSRSRRRRPGARCARRRGRPRRALARERDEAGDGRPESGPREQVGDRARLVGAKVADVGHGREP